jgi:hypothetical protein
LAESPTPPPASAGQGRIARLLLAVLAGCLLLFGWYYWRGTAASAPVDPQTPQDGVICQLARADDGGTDVRTAVVIPVPLDDAWRILSDYEEWERLFKTVRRKQVAEPAGENRHHVVSEVWTPMGMLSLDFIVTHERTAAGGYVARWDAPTNELPVNRGTIEITPLAGEQTLFVYTVRKHYKSYPDFLVNNALLNHQPDLIATLSQRMIEVAQEHGRDPQ